MNKTGQRWQTGKSPQKSARDIALGLLARREHSTAELRHKLLQKGCARSDIENTLENLQTEGLLSDQRFVEAYVHMRKQRGYGPLRILAELREKGIASELALARVYAPEHDWTQMLHQVCQRKYNDQPITDYQDRAKRIAQLQARGFPLNTIFLVLKKPSDIEA